jgi:hypothetical protein
MAGATHSAPAGQFTQVSALEYPIWHLTIPTAPSASPAFDPPTHTVRSAPLHLSIKERLLFSHTISDLAFTMCQIEKFQSHTCAHKWMSIVKPCRPNASFNNRLHKYKPVRSGLQGFLQPGYISAPANTCPNCDRQGDYDAERTRFILESPANAGNLGNGYDMTDGHGNVLRPKYQYGWGGIRIRVPPYPRQGGCCVVM